MNKLFSLFLLLFLFLTLFSKAHRSEFYFFPHLVGAADDSASEKLKEKIHELEDNLRKTRKKSATLSSQISYMDSRITLTELKIKQTLDSIVFLEGQVNELSERIGNLDVSLDNLSAVFLSRVVANYKVNQTNPFLLIFSSGKFSDSFRHWGYLRFLQLNDRKVMLSLEETRVNYSLQKEEKEKKQLQLEKLKQALNSQKIALKEQKTSKKRLLAVTQNDEQKYQRLLTQARAELNSLRSFALSRGGSLLPPQPSPDGWYYNQRDQRWGGALIGGSDMPVWEVGCLITSVAMIYTKNGFPTTPLEIASNSSYFFSDTAYILRPWPTPSGFKLVFASYSDRFNFINQELSQGRAVIVHLNIGGDGHFVVIKRKDGDSYIINDPWYGPDLKLTDYYSNSSISLAAVYRKV